MQLSARARTVPHAELSSDLYFGIIPEEKPYYAPRPILSPLKLGASANEAILQAIHLADAATL